jgi:hypothetical protein
VPGVCGACAGARRIHARDPLTYTRKKAPIFAFFPFATLTLHCSFHPLHEKHSYSPVLQHNRHSGRHLQHIPCVVYVYACMRCVGLFFHFLPACIHCPTLVYTWVGHFCVFFCTIHILETFAAILP